MIQTLVEAAILVAGVVAMVLVHRRDEQEIADLFTRRLREQDENEEARRVALYKQQKAMHRTVAASDKAVRKMVDHTTALRDEAIGLQQRVDTQLRRHEGGD